MFDLFGKLRIFCYFCYFCINSKILKCLHFWIYFQTSCYFWKIEQKYCYVWIMKQNINIFIKQHKKKKKTTTTTRMQWQKMARRSTQTPETCSIIKKAGRRPALQIQGKHPMTRDRRTKYTITRNMIFQK